MHLGNPQNYIKEDHLEWSLKTACIRKYCQHQGFQHQGFLNKMFSNSRESYLFAYMKLVTSQIGNNIVICLYNYHVKKKGNINYGTLTTSKVFRNIGSTKVRTNLPLFSVQNWYFKQDLFVGSHNRKFKKIFKN